MTRENNRCSSKYRSQAGLSEKVEKLGLLWDGAFQDEAWQDCRFAPADIARSRNLL